MCVEQPATTKAVVILNGRIIIPKKSENAKVFIHDDYFFKIANGFTLNVLNKEDIQFS